MSLLDEAGDNVFAEQTFTVTNTGTGVLTLGADAVSLADSAGRPSFTRSFRVTQQPDGQVAPGGNTTFTVRFDPPGAGPDNTLCAAGQ